MAVATVAVALIAVASISLATRDGGKERVFVANPGSTPGGITSTTGGARISIVNNGGHAPHEYPYDLIGTAPPIAIDHVGKYAWTSPVVVRFLPGQWNFSYQAGGSGTADITNPNARLVKVTHGVSLRVTFTVTAFTGAPTVRITSHANGPSPTTPPKGYVLIPDVRGMTQAHATEVLNQAKLGVVVAAETTGPGVVVAESPIPTVAAREHSVVTITIGAPGKR